MIKVNNTFINPAYILTLEFDFELRELKQTGKVRLIFKILQGIGFEMIKTDWFGSKRKAVNWYKAECKRELWDLRGVI